MAILGYLIDKSTQSRVGDALTGLTLATIPSSLPSTPTQVLPIMRSVQAIGHNPPVTLLGFGGNQSIGTIGFLSASTASCPTILFDVYQTIFHSIVR
jgi:hypothetical protein